MAKVYEPANLIDARAAALANPTEFFVPSAGEFNLLTPGHLVKIGVTFKADKHVLNLEGPTRISGERFWVRVTSATTGLLSGAIVQLIGEVTNELVYTHIHGLKEGDLVRFEPRHVLEIDSI